MNLAFHSDMGNWQHYATVLNTWGTRDLSQAVLKWGSEAARAWPERMGKRPIPMLMRIVSKATLEAVPYGLSRVMVNSENENGLRQW
ncbi:hypothetical protein D8674_034947 [Pyrus ussuriensis x Pyrus communis]|uniref:Uncharacterized protein n=1 Tax=Pyrus ussuriensis x Pyrus communis TaxID=2448454 RepID=A0A5N5GFQ4_9ROSA|nr:hypothetical protein D8674_034947 [Pyrus ussuriensis x Pyrus communis]